MQGLVRHSRRAELYHHSTRTKGCSETYRAVKSHLHTGKKVQTGKNKSRILMNNSMPKIRYGWCIGSNASQILFLRNQRARKTWSSQCSPRGFWKDIQRDPFPNTVRQLSSHRKRLKQSIRGQETRRRNSQFSPTEWRQSFSKNLTWKCARADAIENLHQSYRYTYK